jgi:hypothetical protein
LRPMAWAALVPDCSVPFGPFSSDITFPFAPFQRAIPYHAFVKAAIF